jgi:hypothetical protein
MSAQAIHITGNDCEMLLSLHDVISFDYKDSREAPAEVGEETKKEYPTVIEMNYRNGDRVGILEFADN